MAWDSATVKAQFRLTSQKLGQIQAKQDSQANITRKDVATLLRQGNVGLARAKTQKLITEDSFGDLLEILEMHIGTLLERFSELDQRTMSPILVEGASTIIFAAPQIQSKDLEIVRSTLIQHLGPDFTRSAITNRDHYVSSRVIAALSAPSPSASQLDACLEDIARTYEVKWTPAPQRQDIVNPLSELLDVEASPLVDLHQLRRLCVHGIPDEPSWLRPRIWKLFFGVLPVRKASWKNEITQQRETYYDLVRRLLRPFIDLPAPSTPLVSLDASLLRVGKQLNGVPPNLFNLLEEEPESFPNCPLDQSADKTIRIESAYALDLRWTALETHEEREDARQGTPEIRLEAETEIPGISLSNFDEPLQAEQVATTLLPSKLYAFGNAHPRHCSALLRLLYLHTAINPGNLSPHVPSLLVPLYVAMLEEIEPEDLAHVEADAFWVFEAMIAEFSELEDAEGGATWMKKFSERLAWADGELWDSLHAKGLDPALPHYSYRWLAPILTHTLPRSSVFIIWDALFSCPTRQRESNPKLDLLLDICTSMLIRARTVLFRLGKPGRRSPSLWGEESAPPASPLRSWEMGDAFLEGMSVLQLYPIEAAGGIEIILQTASDLVQRREQETRAVKTDKLSLGARLKVSMWKGFTNQVSSPEDSSNELEADSSDDDSSPDDGNETETPSNAPTNAPANSLTSQIATTVWRGITNQSSMEAPLTPVSARSPAGSPAPTSPVVQPADAPQTPSGQVSSIWGYAEKLKDSDTLATLAKVSSNWRARALMGSWGRATGESTEGVAQSEAGSPTRNLTPVLEERRSSLPSMDRSALYSPPPRPSYFRPPRDSFIAPKIPLSPPITDQSPQSTGGLLSRTRSILSAGRSPPTSSSKSGPRPLLLNSSTLITSGLKDSSAPRVPNTMSTPDTEEWADVMKTKNHHLQRGSLSSISSLSPSDAFARPVKSSRSDWDSDTGGSSRLVPLNRRSVSPMAPNFRIPNTNRQSSRMSPSGSSDGGFISPQISSSKVKMDAYNEDLLNSGRDRPHSPVSHGSASSPNRSTAQTNQLQQEAAELSESDYTSAGPSVVRKPRKILTVEETSDSSVAGVPVPPRSPRIRSKRYPLRPANLQIQDSFAKTRSTQEIKNPSPSSLTVEWPADDQDMIPTPKASGFELGDPDSTSPISNKSSRRARKVSIDSQGPLRKSSGDAQEPRARKTSTSHRSRKISGESMGRKGRESAAEEGDDEGYDDLLSAYESEEGAQVSIR